MFRTWNWNQISHYAASKLLGSGMLYLATILVIKGFRFETWPAAAKYPLLWFYYYGYAAACAVLIDFLTRETIREDLFFYKIPLYLAGGIIPFVVMLGGFNFYSMLASLIGIACASIYYGVSSCAFHSSRLRPYSGVMSLIITAFLIVLVLL